MRGPAAARGGATGANRYGRWALAVFAALIAFWLAWQIIAVAMARANTEEAPDEALRWRPAFAAALSGKAEQAYPDAALRGDTAPVEKLARHALAVSPLEVSALRLLAAAAEVRGEQGQALRLMSTAARRSLRDTPAQQWMFRYQMKRRNYAEAFRHGEALMHVSGARQPTARAMAAAAASDPRARRGLVALMERSPDARQAMVRELSVVLDPAALFDILAGLKDAGSEIKEDEAALVVQRLVRSGQIDSAFLAWVQLLPAKGRAGLGNVYDGDFEGLPGSAPFNWRLRDNDAAELAPTPEGEGSSLYIHYDGEHPAQLIEQLILLPPGPYRLRLRALPETAGQGGQLHWSIVCRGQGKTVLTDVASPNEALVWRELSSEFVVPAGCPVQLIQLQGQPGDRLDFVKAWFDGLIIEQRGGA